MLSTYKFVPALLAALLATSACAQAPAGETPVPGRTLARADFNTCAKPVWPKEALRKEQTGAVTLKFLIGTDGAVKDALVTTSSGFPLLDEAALAGLGKCVFAPGSQDGKPREAWMAMQYVWTLTPGNDLAKRVAAAREGAYRGESVAQFTLAQFYYQGFGVERDMKQYKNLLELSAAQGHAKAREALGRYLLRAKPSEADRTEGVRLIRLAAEQGIVKAQAYLGTLLEDGKLVAADSAESLIWYRKAAEQGDMTAQYGLGAALAKTAGPQGEQTEALAWLERAAALGERRAMVAMAKAYETGNGVGKDASRAFALYSKAAATGWYDARIGLAGMYERGEGVAMDPARARELLERAELSKQ